jgi:hypothetical protein
MTEDPQQPERAVADADLTDVPAFPRPVLPYDSLRMQAETDQRFARYAGYALLILIAVGVFALAYGGLPPGAHAIVLFAVMLAVAIVVIVNIPRTPAPHADPHELELPIPRRTPDDRVLDYGRPAERHVVAQTARIAGGFGLLLLGGVLGIAAMLGLGAMTRNPEIAICGPVLAGVILLFVRGARPFGVGLILSPALAFMIVFAICAGFR